MMICSLNRKTCIKLPNVGDTTGTVKDISKGVLKTEDTGKIFEMAICMAYNIEYKGKFKYGLEEPEQLSLKLSKLVDDLFLPNLIQHTAQKGGRYDFTNGDKFLSAKTTKKGVGKIAPQVIGQAQPKKFCELLGIPFIGIHELKQYIQIKIKEILPVLVEYTFDCPNIYYNEQRSTIKWINLIKPIDWNMFEYTWTCEWDIWNNSSTLKIKASETFISLVEFQIHTKSRTNMAIRWFYDNFLNVFKDHLEIITVYEDKKDIL